MSSSYPEARAAGAVFGWTAPSFVVICALAQAAHAADTYVLPEIDLRVETNDNFDLEPDGSSGSDVGYIADLQALIGIATPRSDTSMLPRVRLQEYPDQELERLEAFLDVNNLVRWERAEMRTIGRFSRRDSYNADLEGGEFNPTDPGGPTDPSTDSRTPGNHVTRFQVRPEYVLQLSERTGIGANANFSGARYGSDDLDVNNDYDALGGGGFMYWQLDERREVRLGAYLDRYEITDGSTETDSYGGQVELRNQWSETMNWTAMVFYEESERKDFIPLPDEERTSGVGGELSGAWQGEVSQLQFSVGRTFAGTGARGKSELDQLRLQYQRHLTQRVSLKAVGRLESRTAIASTDESNDRDFARADLVLRWMVTPTWYVQGGYAYIWEDQKDLEGDAANNRFFVSFGYVALDTRRR